MESRNKHRVVFSLGSNVGDRYQNLLAGFKRLKSIVNIENVSSAYLTSPVDYFDQPQFINTCMSAQTSIAPKALMEACLAIENTNQYKKMIDKGPRGLDIDIIFYDSFIIKEDDLEIPHPRYSQRQFVLIPLLEILNPPIDPSTGVDLESQLKNLCDQEEGDTQHVQLDRKWNPTYQEWQITT